MNWLAVMILMLAMAGCAVRDAGDAPKSSDGVSQTDCPPCPEVERDDPNAALNDFSRSLRWGAGLLVIAAILGSAVLFFVSKMLIPLWAGGCIGLAGVFTATAYATLAWGPLVAGLLLIVTLVLGILAAIPLLYPWYRQKWREMLDKNAKHLIEVGEPRAAVALESVALGITDESHESKTRRRARLHELENKESQE